MNRNLRFVAGSALIVAAFGYLMYTAIRETSSYYLTIQEFLPRKAEYANAALRIAGRVAPGSIDYDAKTLRLRFHLTAFAEAGAAADTVAVAFTGIKPDMFAEGRDVIVEGRYADGVVQARQVLTSCPSKYEAKAAAAAPPGGGAG
ncbi:MAG: cytochrome c maturation protein CcmE [Deltaproteobacteria bacterium]|nr:cytochrome c maturation protein CcmE [Deltaproteobacteria bacterium]